MLVMQPARAPQLSVAFCILLVHTADIMKALAKAIVTPDQSGPLLSCQKTTGQGESHLHLIALQWVG